MKKLLLLGLFIFTIGCSSDDSSEDTTSAPAAMELDAVGTLSEQTVEEAKKTIYGKWDLSSSSSSSRVSCKFVYVEFMSESYFMTLDIDGEMQQFTGSFNVTENASGKVEKVELMLLNPETDLEFKVATITNMVVVKSGEALNASFNVVLSLPAADFASCNEALSGDVSAEKEEPMAESSDATSNHAKFVGTWEWVTVTHSKKSSYSLNDELNQICMNYSQTSTVAADGTVVYSEGEKELDPDCTPASKIYLTVSTFGTYAIMFVNADDLILQAEVGTWSWADSSQAKIIIPDGDEENSFDELTLVSVSSTEFVIDNEDEDEDGVIRLTAKKLSN